MVDVIWADRFGREKGYVGKVAGDFTIGTENTFALKVESSAGISQDCYLMIDGTEYGGIVDGVEIDTSADYVTVSGRTWHGLLASRLVVPDAGQLHYTVSGDLNAVLGELVQRLGLWERMAAEEGASGMSVSAWKFSRASADMDAYTGIRAMLRSAGAKLRIRYDSAQRKAVREEVFESSSAEAAELEEDGIKRLREMQEEMSECGLTGADDGRYDIDDIVGGTSVEHGESVVTYVAQKIATVTSRGITYETKTAMEV